MTLASTDTDRESVEFLGRILPHSQELEQAVLSAMLQDPPDAVPVAMEILTHESFYYPAHQIVFDQLVRMQLAEQEIDVMTATEQLRSRELLDRVGGESYLIALVAAVPDATAVHIHAQEIHRKATLRALISLCDRARTQAYDGEKNVSQILAEHENAIALLSGALQVGTVSTTDDAARALLAQYATRTEYDAEGEYQTLIRTAGIVPTKIPDIDKVMGGFEPGELILLAGQTSHGKSAFALEMAQRMAASNIAVGIFTLEMTQTQLTARMLARAANINGRKFRTGNFDRGEMGRLKRAYEELATLPIIIDDTPNQTLDRIKARARQMIIRDKVKLLILDNLELLERRGRKDDEEGYANTLAASRFLKQMAGDLEIPILVLRQLTRDTQRDLVERKQERTPWIGRIRWAGEHDANTILILVDTDYEKRNLTLEDPHNVHLFVAKGRDVGSSAKPIKFTYIRHHHRFADEPEGEENA